MEQAPSPKKNKRLMKGISHVGGAMISSTNSSTNPNEISEEEIKSRRVARENREDIAAAFGGY